jgi:RNA polymerase sigma factor (sigma-70 family)
MDGALTVAAGAVDADLLVAEMFDREGTSLVRLARVFCDDRDAAEDLVQEAFIRLHRSAGTIRDLGRAPAFLRSIVINHRGTTERAIVTPGPSDRAVADEETASVLGALRTLPDRQRACLVLRYYEELSIAEIAATLGISENSVKTHCRRGLAALESRLEAST